MRFEGTYPMTVLKQKLKDFTNLAIFGFEELLTENENLQNQVEAYKEILETRREHEARADERYSELKEENKRLREALQMISNGMDISDHDPLKEQIVGYFRGIAEAALKNGG